MNSKTVLAKVGRKKSHRDSLQMNLLNDLIVYEYLTTTKAKSRLILGNFDGLINIATGKLDPREKARNLMTKLHNEAAVAKLLEVYNKRFEKEKSGFVKVYKVGNRKGDNADMVKLIVKGYVYKEIGKKVSSKASKKEDKKEVKEDTKKVQNVMAQKDLSRKDQVQGAVSSVKIKTRSGI